MLLLLLGNFSKYARAKKNERKGIKKEEEETRRRIQEQRRCDDAHTKMQVAMIVPADVRTMSNGGGCCCCCCSVVM
jgi:hypothetical protein